MAESVRALAEDPFAGLQAASEADPFAGLQAADTFGGLQAAPQESSGDIVDRGNFLPLGRTRAGDLKLAVPGVFHDPAQTVKGILDSEIDSSNITGEQVAGLASVTGFAGSVRAAPRALLKGGSRTAAVAKELGKINKLGQDQVLNKMFAAIKKSTAEVGLPKAIKTHLPELLKNPKAMQQFTAKERAILKSIGKSGLTEKSLKTIAAMQPSKSKLSLFLNAVSLVLTGGQSLPGMVALETVAPLARASAGKARGRRFKKQQTQLRQDPIPATAPPPFIRGLFGATIANPNIL